MIEREETSKQLWRVETLSVNSLIDIYEIFIYLHRMTSAFMSVTVHHRGHALTIAVLTRSLQALIYL